MLPIESPRLDRVRLADRWLRRRKDPNRLVRERLLRHLLDTQRRRDAQRQLGLGEPTPRGDA